MFAAFKLLEGFCEHVFLRFSLKNRKILGLRITKKIGKTRKLMKNCV